MAMVLCPIITLSALGFTPAAITLQMAEQAIALDQLHEPSWRLALQAEHSLGLRESITRRYDDLTRSSMSSLA
jgi:hypothetical protein